MEDIYQCIFQYLPITDIITCKQVSKTFHKIIKLEILWKNINNINFPRTNIFKINFYETCKLHILLQRLHIILNRNISYIDSINLYSKKKLNNKNSYINLYNKKKLNLTHVKFTYIPTEFGILNNLHKLTFMGNKSIYIPTELALLTNLQELHLSHNKFTHIPTELGLLSKLEILSLAFNKLTFVPTELGLLSNLLKLYLYNYGLHSIPSELGNLNKLEYLHLSSVTVIPQEIKQLNCKIEVMG